MSKTVSSLNELYLGVIKAKTWDECARYIHENYPMIREIYAALREQDLSDYPLDYHSTLKQTQALLKSEEDPSRKITLYILAIHQVVYEWMSSEYDMKMIGEEEMSVLPDPIIYYIHISSKVELNVRFHAFMLLYALESCINRHFYVGLDFEQSTVYTEKEIRLTQLCFEHNKDYRSMIMLINPTELEPEMTSDYINLLFCNNRIKKILHGSDSQDIPYIYRKLFADDTDLIIRFTQSMIDTRYLCEYYRLTVGEVPSNRCKIYDSEKERSGVLILGVVSEEQQEKLTVVLGSMGHHLDITWDIHNLSKPMALYAVYDVIFLKYLYYHIIYLATQSVKPDLVPSIIDLYKHGINEFVRFVYLENNGITFLGEKCKNDVNPVNNYFVKKNGKVVPQLKPSSNLSPARSRLASLQVLKMIDVYNNMYQGLVVPSMHVEIDNLLKVNQIRKSILLVIKRMIYGSMTRSCKIHKNKTQMFTERWQNDFILPFFSQLQFHYLAKLFQQLGVVLDNKINQLCQ